MSGGSTPARGQRWKYEGYIKRQLLQVERLRRLEDKMIPDNLDYAVVRSLSTEGREQLTRVRPRTLGRAGQRGDGSIKLTSPGNRCSSTT